MPNVGPYIYDVSIFGFTRSSIYIYEISSLRVNFPEVEQLVFWRVVLFQFHSANVPNTFLLPSSLYVILAIDSVVK